MHKNAIAALADLQRHVAKGLPTAHELEHAAVESHWSGKTSNGASWSLVKVGEDDFQVNV